MPITNTAQPDTLADVKDAAKPFNEKLKRVLKDKPAKDLAKLLGLQVHTIYQWKSRGHQPAAHQLPIVAKFAGCSLDYLCDNSISIDADPQQVIDLGSIKDEALMAEVKKRLTETAQQLIGLLDRAEQYPWEAVAAWLLSRFVPPTPSNDFVLAGIELFKDIEPRAARFMVMARSAGPAGGHVTAWDGGMPMPINLETLLERSEGLREDHPGILAFSYYLQGFDEDWHPGMVEKYGDTPTPDWDDRRSWLMAQLVSHETLKNVALYDPIRARLRKMNYLDAEGNARDFGYSRDGLGDFELPEPSWD